MIKCTCPYCGSEFFVPPSRVRRSKQVFCSQLCNNRYHNPSKNKSLMTAEVREKLSQARAKDADISSYKKHLGRHLHRENAEKLLGRELLPGEVVHHINKDRSDNSPENLFVFPSQAEHARWHMLDRMGKAPDLRGGEASHVSIQSESASGAGSTVSA